MSEQPSTPVASSPKAASPKAAAPTPLKCFTGALISGPAAIALYFMTLSIAQTFANKPIHSDNTLAIRISALVRTLVIGMSALGMAIFAIATLGLVALGIQLLVQKKSPES